MKMGNSITVLTFKIVHWLLTMFSFLLLTYFLEKYEGLRHQSKALTKIVYCWLWMGWSSSSLIEQNKGTRAQQTSGIKEWALFCD